MIFDLDRGKCVALIGERCKYGFDEEEDGYGVASPWYGKADCVQGATCGPSGICSCPTGTFEHSIANKCVPVKNYGELCLERSECNQEKFLNCVKGTCKCDPDNAVYNTEVFQSTTLYDRNYNYRSYEQGYDVPSGICIGRAGTRCSYQTGKHCIRNSKCDVSETCVCNNEYTETSERLCGLGYDQTCSNDAICSDKLRCASAKEELVHNPSTREYTNYQLSLKCQCPHPMYQKYDSTSKVCRGYVGAPCDPSDSLSCINQAICSEKNNAFTCDCPEGFVETEDGKCDIRHGFACDYTNRVIPMSRTQLCDRLANLRCKGGKCSCLDEADIYEHNRRQCSTSIGIRCNSNEWCVENSFCKMDENKKLRGRCACNIGFEVTRNRSCAQVLQMENAMESESKEILTELLEDALKNNMNNTLPKRKREEDYSDADLI